MSIFTGLDSIKQSWKNPSWLNLMIVMPWALGAIFLICRWNIDRQIAVREKTVVGTITAHEPANHNRYGYTFIVEGKSYTGWEIPQHKDPAMGELVTVYFDPVNPSTNGLTDFEDISWGDLGPVPLLLSGVGIVTTIIILQRRRFQMEQDLRA